MRASVESRHDPARGLVRGAHAVGIPGPRLPGPVSEDMAEVSVVYDREGQTLTVWFSDRRREHVCEETGDEVVLMKDSTGRVIGFEKLNFSIPEADRLRVALETTLA